MDMPVDTGSSEEGRGERQGQTICQDVQALGGFYVNTTICFAHMHKDTLSQCLWGMEEAAPPAELLYWV